MPRQVKRRRTGRQPPALHPEKQMPVQTPEYRQLNGHAFDGLALDGVHGQQVVGRNQFVVLVGDAYGPPHFAHFRRALGL